MAAASLASEPAFLISDSSSSRVRMRYVDNKSYPPSSTKVIETVDNRSYSFVAMEPGELIKQRREELNLSQADLARRVGISQPAIKKIESGETDKSKFLPRVALELGLDLAELDPSLRGAPQTEPDPSLAIPQEHLVYGNKDFPIFASAEGGHGEILITTEPVDFQPRPSNLEKVKGAYGLYITGTSMFPEYRNGDTALVNPNLPIIGNEVYVFYGERDGTARATIKHLRTEAPSAWRVTQWNPPEDQPRDFNLDRSYWRIAHRVIGKYSRQ